MTPKHVREIVETIDQSTVREHRPILEFQKTVIKGDSSMTSEHVRETVQTIARSTVRELAMFLENSKKIPNYIYIRYQVIIKIIAF